jgi:hypothetical protein
MQDNGSTSLITLDGTDFRIFEPKDFDRKWFSHKFKGPGLRYEIGVCIQTGWIVWVNGPYPCGRYPDLCIARHRIQHVLDEGEKYVADGGYKDGGQYGDTPTGLRGLGQKMKKAERSRHETVNGRFKVFSILNTNFFFKMLGRSTGWLSIP